MNPETDAWIASAEVDYRLAIRAVQDPAIPEGVCFHAQQCLEKYLKALLEQAREPVPRTHDLGTLHELATHLPPDLSAYESDLKAMGPFAVAVRYPGGETLWGDLVEEAELAARTMETVRGLIRRYFGLVDSQTSEDETL